MNTEEIIVPSETGAGSRAVVLCKAQSGEAMHLLPSVRNDSSFVAQLIATADNLPQTRHRRRAEPRVAVAAYTMPHDLPPTCGHTRRVA